MLRMVRLSWLILAAVLLIAADASWKQTPIAQWNEEAAKQVLSDSPWAKSVTPQWVRDLSPNECEQSGDWSGCTGKGVGLAGIGLFGSARQEEALERAHEKPQQRGVVIRWESALPIRMAEQKAGETNVPMLDSDHYAIAVYDIPTPKRWNLARELKGIAFIKRDKKKDLRPTEVEILRHLDGRATIVYLFPASTEISKREGRLSFQAQIGRLFVSQDFNPAEMQLNDQLEVLLPPNSP